MKKKSKFINKSVIGVTLTILTVMILTVGVVYIMNKNDAADASVDINSPTEKEYVKLSGDIEGFTDEQMDSIENEVIPLASEFFEYEEARVYYSKHVGYVISFLVTNESFGKTYSEYLDPTKVNLQSEAIEMIHQGFKEASMELDSVITQSEGVTMEFSLPNMESLLLMKVRGGEFIVTPFEEEE